MSDINFISASKDIDHLYTKCKATFSSRNKLFRHLKERYWKLSPTATNSRRKLSSIASDPSREPITSTMDSVEANFAAPIAVRSEVLPDKSKSPGFDFRGWKYATLKVNWSGISYLCVSGKQTKVCLDSGCSVILIDRVYLKKMLLNATIRKILFLIPVRGVGSKIVRIDKYIEIEMHVYSTIND